MKNKRRRILLFSFLILALFMAGVWWWRVETRPYVVRNLGNGFIVDLTFNNDSTILAVNYTQHKPHHSFPPSDIIFLKTTNLKKSKTYSSPEYIASLEYLNPETIAISHQTRKNSPFYLSIIDLNTFKSFSTFTPSWTKFSVSPNGEFIAVGGEHGEKEGILVFDSEKLELITVFDIDFISYYTKPIVSPDSSAIAVSLDQSIQLVDMNTHQQSRIPAEIRYGCFSFSSEGDKLVQLTNKNEIITWDTKSQQVLNQSSLISSIDYTEDCEIFPDNNLLVRHENYNQIAIYDIHTGQRIHSPFQIFEIPPLRPITFEYGFRGIKNHLSSWYSFAKEHIDMKNLGRPIDIISVFTMSPDGKYLAIGTEFGNVYLYDLTSILPEKYFED